MRLMPMMVVVMATGCGVIPGLGGRSAPRTVPVATSESRGTVPPTQDGGGTPRAAQTGGGSPDAASGGPPAPPAGRPNADDKRRWAEWVELTQPNSDGLFDLHQMETGEHKGGYFDTAHETAAKMMKAKAFLGDCPKYADLVPPENAYVYRTPARACALAARADELMPKFVELTARDLVDEAVKSYRSYLRMLTEDGKLYESSLNAIAFADDSRKFIGDKVAKLYEKTGVSMPADILEGFDDLAAAFAIAVEAGVQKTTLPTEHNADGTAEKVVKDHFGRSELRKRKYKVKKTWIESDDWQIVRGRAELPVRREKYGWVMVQLDGEKFCRLYAMTVAQDYAGAGKYQAKGYAVVNDQARVARCK